MTLQAINSMELQKISEVMDKFESQFEDLDVKTSVSITNYKQYKYGMLMHKLVKASRGNCYMRLICFAGDGGVDGRCDDHDGAGRASGRPHSAGCRRGRSRRRRTGSVS